MKPDSFKLKLISSLLFACALAACGGSSDVDEVAVDSVIVENDGASGDVSAAPGTGADAPSPNTAAAPPSPAPGTSPSAADSGAPAEQSTSVTWITCAREWSRCRFSGTRSVRYGIPGRLVTKTFTNGVECTNHVFGDPAYGIGKTCWYAERRAPAVNPAPTAPSAPAPSAPPEADTPTTAPPSASPARTTSGSVPTPASIKGKRVVGRITARSGQIIENVHVTTESGSCIVIPANVTNVIIRDSEIGPCGVAGDRGTQGVQIDSGASDITIQRNVIHDVSSGVYAVRAKHPIIMDRNYAYNIRGPIARGQLIQLNGVTGGSRGSRITCNVSDALPGTRHGVSHDLHDVEDHINIFDSPGLANDRTEIAYNRLRGGHSTSTSGSGIMTGDGPALTGNNWVHHNIITNVRNVGIGIAGGKNTTVEDNVIFQDGTTVSANVGIFVHNYSKNECSGHSVINNRVFTRKTQGGTGQQASFWQSGNCGSAVLRGNVFGDTSLSAALFNETPEACK